jgi:hypothetical protein
MTRRKMERLHRVDAIPADIPPEHAGDMVRGPPALMAGFFMRGRMGGMKSISASIVVLAGALTFSIGATIAHGDTQLAVCIPGAVLGIGGLYAWIMFLGKSE